MYIKMEVFWQNQSSDNLLWIFLSKNLLLNYLVSIDMDSGLLPIILFEFKNLSVPTYQRFLNMLKLINYKYAQVKEYTILF